MSETTHLSPLGVFPDVCVSVWGLTVTYKIHGGNLIVERRYTSSALLHSEQIDVSMPDSTFPRVMQALDKTWIAYRAFRHGQESAVAREVLLDHLGAEHVLGPTWGNNPVCLSADGLVAWQEWLGNRAGGVNGMRLDTGEVFQLRSDSLPPGLSHFSGNHVVFVDENRASEPGMLNPVRSGELIVGEGFQEGLIARIPNKDGSVMGGECLTPRCAQIEPGAYAAVTWGPGRGAFLILFGSDDIQAPVEPSLPALHPITPRTQPEFFYPFFTCSGRPSERDRDPKPDDDPLKGLLYDYPQNVIGPIGDPLAVALARHLPNMPVMLGGLSWQTPGGEQFRQSVKANSLRPGGIAERTLTLWCAAADENPVGGERSDPTTPERIAAAEIVAWRKLFPHLPTPPVMWYVGPQEVSNPGFYIPDNIDVLMPEFYFTAGLQEFDAIRREYQEKKALYEGRIGRRRKCIPVWQCFRRSDWTKPSNMRLIARMQQQFFAWARELELNVVGNAFFAILRVEGAIEYPEAMESHARMFAAIPAGRLPALAPVPPPPTPPEPIPTPPDPPAPVPVPPDPPVPTPTPDPEPLPIPVPDPPQPIPDPPPIPVPVPPDEADTMRPPAVTVDRWTLDELVNGREMAVHDRENPELGYRFRVFVRDGSVHAEITNNAGSAQTGTRRPVKTGGSQPAPQPQPTQPAPQPSPGGGITLKTVNGFFLTVTDGVLRSSTQPSGFTFEQHGDKWALKVNGRYLRAVDGGGKELRTDRDEAGSHELFTVFKTGDAVAIQTMTGHFISAIDGGNGEVKANQRLVGGWESFISSRPFDQAPTRAALQGRIRVDGRFFANDAGTFRWRFTSALTLLTKNDVHAIAFLDWAAAEGFNGIRVFAGHLAWAGQTVESARQRLPWLLEQAAARGLYVEITCLTDTKAGGYDKRAHVGAIGEMVRNATNAVTELANEVGHPTQDDETNHPEYLVGLRHLIPSDVLCSVGAPGFDEPEPSGHFPFPTLDFVTLHLDRGREDFNMVRRVRELEAVSGAVRKPVINNEPIGADEVRRPGSREDNPSLFYTLGVLNRIFEVGGVHHSQHGLMAELPGPNQQACAEAFIAGSTVIPTEDRLDFKNARWADSPVAEANFDDESGAGTVVRVYTGVAGNRAWTAMVGLNGDPQVQLQNGWHFARDLGNMPGIRVVELERN